MSVNSKMTAIADPIRTLTGKTDTMGLDAMANDLDNAVAEVDAQNAIIEQIKTTLEGKAAGGLTPPTDDFLTPEDVYRLTRPASWLPMPNPTDYECYFLGQLLPGVPGYFNATFTFTGTCVVELGTLVNGEFVAKESHTPTSDSLFSVTLDYNNYGDELADGTRQYMARVTGQAITKIVMVTGQRPPSLVVDIKCGIALSRFNTGNYNSVKSSLGSLRYLNFVGKGKPGWIQGVEFANTCRSLLSIGCEAKNDSSYAAYACHGSGSLLAASPNLFAGVSNELNRTFYGTSIRAIKLPNIQPRNTEYFFYSTPLKSFTADTLDTSLSSNISSMFNLCYSLQSVTGLDISSATNVNGLFGVCYNLSRLTFAGETTPGGYTISLTDTRLSHAALVETIASLPVATNAATLNITGNHGAAELTDDEIAVATAKNWTITR